MEGSMDLSEDMALHSRMRGGKKKGTKNKKGKKAAAQETEFGEDAEDVDPSVLAMRAAIANMDTEAEESTDAEQSGSKQKKRGKKGGKKKKQKKGKKKKGKNDAAKSDELEFDNPIASVTTDHRTFEDSGSESSELSSSEEESEEEDTFESELADQKALRMKKKHMENPHDEVVKESVGPGNVGSWCCLEKEVEVEKSHSAIVFDALEVVSGFSKVSLTRENGQEIDPQCPKDIQIDKESIPKGESVDDQNTLAYMRQELAKAKKRQEAMHQGGASSTNKGLMANATAKMHDNNVAEWEAAIAEFTGRDDLKASKDRKKELKSMKRAQSNGGRGGTSSSITLEEPGKPIGITWHWQSGRAVIGLVREGGVASRYQDGQGLMPGMVLIEFRNAINGRRTQVTYKAIKEKLQEKERPYKDGKAAEYLSVLMEMTGRPLTLIFEKKGFTLDGGRNNMSSAVNTEVHEAALGVSVQPLEYVVPKIRGDLGIKFWPTDTGEIICCDIQKPSIMGSPGNLKEGMRTGLILRAIADGDGNMRKMKLEKTVPFHVKMQQIKMVQRPYIAIFDPLQVPMIFTIDENSTCAPSTSADKKVQKLRDGKGFSIFRELGLSLVEEDVSEWANIDQRVRVAGVHAGGMIDRFNRHNRHNWIVEGLTIVSVSSSLKATVGLVGEPLSIVVDAFHAVAPGKTVQLGKGENKRMFSGRDITIGFQVDYRATEVDMAKWMD